MSMARCPLCESVVDTDNDPDFYGPDTVEFPQACESCRADESINREAERDMVCVNNRPHAWRTERDWMGDPTIPNGTMSWTVWRCQKCSFETTDRPDDYEEPEPPERDPA